ncbi:MAG TPA: glycoside hydrolase family 16 protein [Chitinivibrionales bacterium]|jgi:beta-glucanase (GH16 family)|nr:glycoside hydrolase family 16 protein [Chitinivibrionales bacterium]
MFRRTSLETFGLRTAALLVAVILTNAIAGGWKLFWSDEFDSTALNENNWTVDPTDNPPNGEQEHYTAGHDKAGSNIFVKNNTLIIVAQQTSEITSGRMNDANHKTFMYGRMEARMRLPITQGMWPAFWMLGVGGGWPACGEIDIMEGKGRLPNWTSGSYHCTNYDLFNQYTLPKGNVHDSFHLYGVEWSTDSIRWFCDSVYFGTLTKAAHPNVPFDKQYFFILNLAVGGNFDGNIDNSTVFPESLIVDYVRVYNWDPTLNVGAPAAVRRSAPAAAVTNLGTRLSVELPSEQVYAAEVVSVDGRRVLSGRGVARSFSLDLRSLAPGVYLASVRGVFGEAGRRIVVRQ